eukprot:CAMPEP_0201596788 /NCGR_PEP_ID=MMETSP0190_2-20130828/193397_1 /ASSEMBLY_ACC=CAM_ASM_000263 /TAXON_ID=37353 /ORGANISM="Rosalina sp." /LENGTH=402 /DNA_ID=CAMNT_0048057333 /DNA_START=467 /DNA_END=1678 /DNA_ORIENTATION=+
MGPCVVKRTDLDPDSDGEDETKAAYYADKGKAPRSTRKPRGAYTKSDKKRKRSVVNDNGYDDHPQAKRARTSSDPSYVAGGPPPVEPMGYYTNLPPQHHGYYNQNGYMTPENGIARPSYNNAIPPPPPIDDYNESSLPPPPIIESKSENGQSRSPPARIPMPLLSGENNHNGIESMNGDIPPSTEYAIGMNGGQNNEQEESGPPPPPPPLEEFAPLPVDNGVNGNGVHDKNKKADKNNEEAKQEENVDIITMETTTTKGNDNVEQKEEIQTISFDKVCNNKAESMVELNGQNGHKTQNNAPNTTDTGNNKNNNNEQPSMDDEDCINVGSDDDDNNNNEQQSMDDEDCINVGSDDDDLPDLTVPNSSPSPSAKHKKAFSLSTNGNEEQQQAEDEDDDLILSLP